jgi:penicillin-binding protein 2
MPWSFSKIKNFFKKKTAGSEISPDEIFLDSQNLPEFDRDQFEGRLEKPIPKRSLAFVFGFFIFIALAIMTKLWFLEVKEGQAYAERSQNNTLNETTLFSDRGVIYDRNGVPLAWNTVNPDNPDFSLRRYTDLPGLSSLLGFVKYPTKDSSGFYFREDFTGMAGVEKYFNDELQGQNGQQLIETDAQGNVQSQGVVKPPQDGQNLTLTIDSRIQSELYQNIAALAQKTPFSGGSGVIMDLQTGDVIADVSYPEYDSQTMTDGTNTPAIDGYLHDPNNPFLDRVTDGLYTPGSIIKPYIAMGALNEKVIDPTTQILSTGSISLPNPYHPDQPSVFKDWRPQGWVDMVHALAVSSDVYFYEVGGGFQNQKGLGIDNIEKYTRMFGFGAPLNVPFFEGQGGTIPDPAWKAANFQGEAWNIGDTYHTAIGQYGFQVTPIQMAHAYTAIADDGTLIPPRIIENPAQTEPAPISLPFPKSFYDVIHQGMRGSVLYGTSVAINVPYVDMAGKTGTAQLGASKDFDNSWAVGFFPYENPHYVFAIVMEHGPITNLIGSPFIARETFDWMHANTPEYFQQ